MILLMNVSYKEPSILVIDCVPVAALYNSDGFARGYRTCLRKMVLMVAGSASQLDPAAVVEVRHIV